jgi:hypothetical protein
MGIVCLPGSAGKWFVEDRRAGGSVHLLGSDAEGGGAGIPELNEEGGAQTGNRCSCPTHPRRLLTAIAMDIMSA